MYMYIYKGICIMISNSMGLLCFTHLTEGEGDGGGGGGGGGGQETKYHPPLPKFARCF